MIQRFRLDREFSLSVSSIDEEEVAVPHCTECDRDARSEKMRELNLRIVERVIFLGQHF